MATKAEVFKAAAPLFRQLVDQVEEREREAAEAEQGSDDEAVAS